jgi:outer membrane receptor protein involved in Fe transport
MFIRTRPQPSAVASLLLLSLTCAPSISEAQVQPANGGATIVGSVIDIQNGLPVSGAVLSLYVGSHVVATASTNGSGTATFANEPPGVYHVDIRAQGYNTGRSDDVVVNPGASGATIRLTLERASLSTGTSLRQIGHVSSATQRSQLQSTSTITQNISPERLQRENYARVGDSLYTLPGVNLGSQDSAIGDDLYLNIRGIGDSESAVMLDEHPIGPFGAGGSSFNLQLTPFWGLKNVDVVFGSGSEALYGTDALAGAVDLQTLAPTRTPQANFTQGFGNQGKRETAVTSTGTLGRVGYAIESSVQGTYGQFKPGPILQSGFLANSQDFSTAGIASAGALYGVSANYLLRDNLAKLTYAFSPKTNVAFQYYTSSSIDDKTGNGDNDAFGADYSLNAVLNGPLLAGGPGSLVPLGTGGPTPCAPVGGNNVASIPVTTNHGVSCLSPSQYALATSGPAGGGGGRWQWDALRDATMKLDHQFAGNNNFNATLYTDSYGIATTRYPKTQSARYKTFGIQLSDDVVTATNDFGVGYFSPHQQEAGDQVKSGVLVANPTLGQSTTNFFLRDNVQVNDTVSVFSNLWIKQSSVTNSTLLDPRLSLVFRPSKNNVVRFTAARASNVPDIGLLQGAASFSQPGAVNVTCNSLTGIGSIPSVNLVPETAKSLELAVGHRFYGDSQIQVAAYDENIGEQLVGTSVALATVPTFLNDSGFLGQLQGYLSKFNSQCGLKLTTAQQLAAITSVSGTLNATNGQYHGIEVSGRARLNRRVYFDYSYDLQSAQYQGLNASTLLKAPNLINGVQRQGIPLQKASLGVDISDNRGLEFRLDGFYVGNNNGYDRPAYTFFNGGISKTFRTGTTLTLGVQNLFNSASQSYGLIGDGVYYPYNPVYAAANAPIPTTGLTNGNEEFGLAPRSIIFALSQRVGR